MKNHDSEPTRPKFEPNSGSGKFSDTIWYITLQLFGRKFYDYNIGVFNSGTTSCYKYNKKFIRVEECIDLFLRLNK